MPDIVFEVDIDADRRTVARAIGSGEGIRGWWTARADVPEAVGEVMSLGFAMAPQPFELRIEEMNDESVRWRSVGEFPPHWASTEVRWGLIDNPDGPGTRVTFRHANWASDDGPFGMSAYTWGRLMTALKTYAETGNPAPLLPS